MQLIEDRRILAAAEVLLRAPRPAAVLERLEVLLRPPRDPRLLQRLADQRAAAARGGTDQIAASRAHGPVIPRSRADLLNFFIEIVEFSSCGFEDYLRGQLMRRLRLRPRRIQMDLALLVLRLVVGVLFAGHGAQKLFGAFG